MWGKSRKMASFLKRQSHEILDLRFFTFYKLILWTTNWQSKNAGSEILKEISYSKQVFF